MIGGNWLVCIAGFALTACGGGSGGGDVPGDGTDSPSAGDVRALVLPAAGSRIIPANVTVTDDRIELVNDAGAGRKPPALTGLLADLSRAHTSVDDLLNRGLVDLKARGACLSCDFATILVTRASPTEPMLVKYWRQRENDISDSYVYEFVFTEGASDSKPLGEYAGHMVRGSARENSSGLYWHSREMTSVDEEGVPVVVSHYWSSRGEVSPPDPSANDLDRFSLYRLSGNMQYKAWQSNALDISVSVGAQVGEFNLGMYAPTLEEIAGNPVVATCSTNNEILALGDRVQRFVDGAMDSAPGQIIFQYGTYASGPTLGPKVRLEYDRSFLPSSSSDGNGGFLNGVNTLDEQRALEDTLAKGFRYSGRNFTGMLHVGALMHKGAYQVADYADFPENAYPRPISAEMTWGGTRVTGSFRFLSNKHAGRPGYAGPGFYADEYFKPGETTANAFDTLQPLSQDMRIPVGWEVYAFGGGLAQRVDRQVMTATELNTLFAAGDVTVWCPSTCPGPGASYPHAGLAGRYYQLHREGDAIELWADGRRLIDTLNYRDLSAGPELGSSGLFITLVTDDNPLYGVSGIAPNPDTMLYFQYHIAASRAIDGTVQFRKQGITIYEDGKLIDRPAPTYAWVDVNDLTNALSTRAHPQFGSSRIMDVANSFGFPVATWQRGNVTVMPRSVILQNKTLDVKDCPATAPYNIDAELPTVDGYRGQQWLPPTISIGDMPSE